LNAGLPQSRQMLDTKHGPLMRNSTINVTKVIMTGSGQIDPPKTITKGISALQHHAFVHKWSWELTIIGSLQNLLDNIRTGNGFAVSDGSFQVGKGAAAWIIEGKTNKHQLIRKCFSPSDKDGHSSFRSKLAGIHMILFTMSTLLLTKGETTPF